MPKKTLTIRGDQMKQVEKFIHNCVGGFPASSEVFFMGDLNILGELRDDCVPTAEWSRTFNTPGRLLMNDLIDLWGHGQCTGHKGLHIKVSPPPQPIILRNSGWITCWDRW